MAQSEHKSPQDALGELAEAAQQTSGPPSQPSAGGQGAPAPLADVAGTIYEQRPPTGSLLLSVVGAALGAGVGAGTGAFGGGVAGSASSGAAGAMFGP